MNKSVKSFKTDPKLVTRMYFTMFMLGVLYAAFSFLLMRLGVPIIFVGIIVGIFAVIQYSMSDKMVLKSTGAKEVSQKEEPELHDIVGMLASRYEMPMPKIAMYQMLLPQAVIPINH